MARGKTLTYIIIFTILVTGLKATCIITCPKGSELLVDCKCECKPDYYRSDVLDFESDCYKYDCQPETKKVLNVTYPSMIPACICDVNTNHWGNNPDDCNVKEGGCPNKDLVRETGECGCRSDLKYVNGECLPELKPVTTEPQGSSTTDIRVPSKKDNNPDLKIALGAGLSASIAAIVAFIVIVLLCLYLRRRKRKKKEKASSSSIELGENIPLSRNSRSDLRSDVINRPEQREEEDEDNGLEGASDLNSDNTHDSGEQIQPNGTHSEIHHHYHNGISIIGCNGVHVGEKNVVNTNEVQQTSET